MQMTEQEIVRSYREAADPNKQISILAQLNCTNPKTIRDILRDHGVAFPGPKPKADKPTTPTVFREKSEKPTKVLQIPKSVESVLKVYLKELTEREEDLKVQLKEVSKNRKEVEDYIVANGGEI